MSSSIKTVTMNSYISAEQVEVFEPSSEDNEWLMLENDKFEVSAALFLRYMNVCCEKQSLERMFRDVRYAHGYK